MFPIAKMRPNEMFVSSPFLYSHFCLNCKLVLNRFNICNSTYVISTLAYSLLILCHLCPILINYNFTLILIHRVKSIYDFTISSLVINSQNTTMTLGAHMRPYDYTYRTPSQDGELHKPWRRATDGVRWS